VSFIKVVDVRKSFGKTGVLNGVDFEINKGDQVSLVGMSGSGKSTLLYLLGGLDKPSSGTIEIDGKVISNLGDDELAKFRNKDVGFVFQFHYLLPSLNCLDNLLLPAKIGGIELSTIKKYVTELSEKLGVTHCLEKFPYELSGGEQQRVNIIRAVSLSPKLILCDEPTGNLDSKNSALVVGLLRDISEKINATLVLVTHDPSIASQFERKITIEDGRIIG
jgi:ABC-type lipoprotein export system ATPase subunit